MVGTADTLLYFSKERGRAIAAYREFVEGEEGRFKNPFEEVEAGLLLGNNRFKLLEKLIKDILLYVRKMEQNDDLTIVVVKME